MDINTKAIGINQTPNIKAQGPDGGPMVLLVLLPWCGPRRKALPNRQQTWR